MTKLVYHGNGYVNCGLEFDKLWLDSKYGNTTIFVPVSRINPVVLTGLLSESIGRSIPQLPRVIALSLTLGLIVLIVNKVH